MHFRTDFGTTTRQNAKKVVVPAFSQWYQGLDAWAHHSRVGGDTHCVCLIYYIILYLCVILCYCGGVVGSSGGPKRFLHTSVD